MRTRKDLSVLLTGAATIWLLVTLWLSLAYGFRPLDGLAIAMAFGMQLGVVMAWDLLPRLPLWIIAGHALIMVSLAIGLVITAPAGAPPVALPIAVPWLVVGLVPAGLAMLVAAGLHWEREEGLVH